MSAAAPVLLDANELTLAYGAERLLDGVSITVGVGEKVGLGAEDLRGLIKGSFIHDVGKIGIPDAVLLKPGRLDEEEYRVMQTQFFK